MTANPNDYRAPDAIRAMNNPLGQHMRDTIARLNRTIDDVREATIVHFSYGADMCPVGLYDLTFSDETTHHQYWHISQQRPLSYQEAMSLVDLDRLAPHERAFLVSGPDALNALSPRNTQFAGFAKRVLTEMVAVNGYIDIVYHGPGEFDADDEVYSHYVTLLAQRAYDLACHVANQVGESDGSAMDCGLRTPQQVVGEMTDLPELPFYAIAGEDLHEGAVYIGPDDKVCAANAVSLPLPEGMTEQEASQFFLPPASNELRTFPSPLQAVSPIDNPAKRYRPARERNFQREMNGNWVDGAMNTPICPTTQSDLDRQIERETKR
jgi:hypothetical protein